MKYDVNSIILFQCLITTLSEQYCTQITPENEITIILKFSLSYGQFTNMKVKHVTIRNSNGKRILTQRTDGGGLVEQLSDSQLCYHHRMY